jgi:chromosome segregation ATPase
MENQYLKIPNYDIFTQKNIPRPSSFNLKCRKLMNYCPDISKFANRASSGYYSTKNIFSNNSNIFPSPHNFNIFSLKTQTPKTKKISRIKPKSASYKRIFPDTQNTLSRSMYSNSCIEAEKLFQETYEIKKVIKHIQNQLNKITKENNKKERQLNAKENEINKIIINNFELNNEDEEDKNNYYNYLGNLSNINELKLSKKNTAVNLLIFKIRREIKNIQSETQKENHKLQEMKKSLFLTKSKELSIESNLYREHINKIKLLIENSLQIKEQNDIKKDEFESLKENIERQNLIIDNLTKENILLENKQEDLNAKLEILQNDLKAKIEQAKKNDNELNILSLKNKNLSKDKLIQKQFNSIKEDIFPISLKSIYTGKVSTLKKKYKLLQKSNKIF